MNNKIKPKLIDPSKLITQAEYAKKTGLSPQRINQLAKAKEIKTLQITGGTLIIL